MIQSRVVALDGHDAAGKTTLAQALADAIGGVYRRPFHGSLGAALLSAGARGDFDEVLALGEQGIGTAIESATPAPIVLDRSWMTVASLIEQNRLPTFFARWYCWIPTALCWADLRTTVQRLRLRDEANEPLATHRRYLKAYRSLAARSRSPIIRTDICSERACLELLVKWFVQDAKSEMDVNRHLIDGQ